MAKKKGKTANAGAGQSPQAGTSPPAPQNPTKHTEGASEGAGQPPQVGASPPVPQEPAKSAEGALGGAGQTPQAGASPPAPQDPTEPANSALGPVDAPPWVLISGLVILGVTLLFFMGLVVAGIMDKQVPCASRFLVVIVLALAAGTGSAFLGSYAAMTGSIPLPGAPQSPVRFGLGGGVAVIGIIILICYYAYVNGCGPITECKPRPEVAAGNTVNAEEKKIELTNDLTRHPEREEILTILRDLKVLNQTASEKQHEFDAKVYAYQSAPFLCKTASFKVKSSTFHGRNIGGMQQSVYLCRHNGVVELRHLKRGANEDLDLDLPASEIGDYILVFLLVWAQRGTLPDHGSLRFTVEE